MNEFFPSGTLQSRGYHMTDTEAENIRNAATVALLQARRTFGVVKEKFEQLQKEIFQVGKEIAASDATRLSTYEFQSFAWLNPQVIKEAAHDVLKAQTEIDNAERKIQQVGAFMPE